MLQPRLPAWFLLWATHWSMQPKPARLRRACALIPVMKAAAHALLSLRVVLALSALTFAASAWAQPCTARFSSTASGTAATLAASSALAPFRLICRGTLIATLRLTGRTSGVQLFLEEHTGESWAVVAKGWNIAYKAMPGEYRYRISPADTNALPDWELDYSLPR